MVFHVELNIGKLLKRLFKGLQGLVRYGCKCDEEAFNFTIPDFRMPLTSIHIAFFSLRTRHRKQ